MLRVVLAVVICWSLVAASRAGGYVTRDGPDLMLDGRPFMYAGANNYYVGIDNLTVGDQPNAAVIDEIIADCRAMNLNVLRVWGFNDHDTPVQPWWTAIKTSRLQTKSAGSVYQRDGTHGGGIDGGVDYFRGLDYLLDRAAANDMRVILPLVNNWQDYGGMAQYVNWSADTPIPNADGANSTWRSYKNAFYTDATAQGLYQTFISYLADRVNTCNGRTYKSDETILAWQLANEPRMATYAGGSHATLDGWVAAAADYLKNSAGVSQLVSVGMEGYYDDSASNTAAGGQAWFAAEGTDYVTNHGHAAIELAGFHLYQQPWGLTDAGAGRWIADHIRTARRAALNRPAIMDEVGYEYDRSGGSVGPRDEHFKQYLRAAYRNMASGVNFWIAYHDTYPDYDQYGVYYPADASTVDVISRYGRKVWAFNKTGVHQLLAFEYDLDGFSKTTGQGVQSISRAEAPGWFVTDDGAAEIACAVSPGDAFTAGAELIDEISQAAGIDVSGFGYNVLLARIMVEDNASFDPGELTIELYDKTGSGWDTRTGGGMSVTEAGRWHELTWDLAGAGDPSDLKEMGIVVSAGGDYTGHIYVEFIGGDLTALADNAPTPGDANWDGWVDGLDYNQWSLHYLLPAGWAGGDFNDDTIADGLDYNIWSLNYAPEGNAAVPEPAAVLLIGVGLTLGISRKSRRR